LNPNIHQQIRCTCKQKKTWIVFFSQHWPCIIDDNPYSVTGNLYIKHLLSQ